MIKVKLISSPLRLVANGSHVQLRNEVDNVSSSYPKLMILQHDDELVGDWYLPRYRVEAGRAQPIFLDGLNSTS